MTESIQYADVRADRTMFADWSALYIELRVIAKQLGHTPPAPVDVDIAEIQRHASALLAAMKLGPQVDPAPAAAAAEVPADLAPIPPRRRDETPGERMNRIDATADALAYLAKTRRQRR